MPVSVKKSNLVLGIAGESTLKPSWGILHHATVMAMIAQRVAVKVLLRKETILAPKTTLLSTFIVHLPSILLTKQPAILQMAALVSRNRVSDMS